MFHRQQQDNSVDGRKLDSESAGQPTTTDRKTETDMSEKESITMTESKDVEKESTDMTQSENRNVDIPGGSSFQQQTQMSQRMAGSSYAAPSYQSPTSSAQSMSDSRRLVIGQGITMSGEIEACDTLVVEGTVEAALKGASVLEISESGVFYGTVEIDEAVVSGTFEGDITVNGRLTITESGSITGTIAYKELAVEAGATVDGKVVPLASKASKKGEKPKATKSAIKGAGPKNDNAGNGSGETLFSEGKAVAAQ